MDTKHRFTKLIFKHEHQRLLKPGPQQLLASIRKRFWQVGGRVLRKKVFHQCVQCFNYRAATSSTIILDLVQCQCIWHISTSFRKQSIIRSSQSLISTLSSESECDSHDLSESKLANRHTKRKKKL